MVIRETLRNLAVVSLISGLRKRTNSVSHTIKPKLKPREMISRVARFGNLGRIPTARRETLIRGSNFTRTQLRKLVLTRVRRSPIRTDLIRRVKTGLPRSGLRR